MAGAISIHNKKVLPAMGQLLLLLTKIMSPLLWNGCSRERVSVTCIVEHTFISSNVFARKINIRSHEENAYAFPASLQLLH